MTTCDQCNTTIIFGGIKEAGLRFCDVSCYQKAAHKIALHHVAKGIPEEEVDKAAQDIFEGNCPKCEGFGPVDIHTSHRVWSLISVSSWRSKPELCCRSCGVNNKLRDSFFTGLLGWWSFHGLAITPIMLARNIYGIMKWTDGTRPSDQLLKMVRFDLAALKSGTPPEN